MNSNYTKEQILATADSYYNISISSLTNNESNISIPFVTNIILSCELYLKYIIVMEAKNIVPFTHDLKCLFQKISGKSFVNIRSKIPDDVWSYAMTYYSNAFEDYRYYFENRNTLNPAIKFEVLICFANVIKEVAHSL